MSILLVIAAALFGLALLLFFGPQAVIYGYGGVKDALKRPEAQFIGGALSTGLTLLLFAPFIATALISDGKTGQLVAETLAGLLGA